MEAGGPPVLDALAKLEMAIRPHSVPSWLSSDTNHAPKITALGPRCSAVEYVEAGGNATSITAAKAGNSSGSDANAAVSGPASSFVRPRAPIVLQKEAPGETDARGFLSKDAMPKRSRARAHHIGSETKSR